MGLVREYGVDQEVLEFGDLPLAAFLLQWKLVITVGRSFEQRSVRAYVTPPSIFYL